jgi:23S rRNA (cytosine1962-C5)-methyltransferase
MEGTARPGDVVSLVDHDGRFIGRGIYNPRSQIIVRLLTRADEPVDQAFFFRRLQEAKTIRTCLGLPNVSTTAFRLVNSEGDGLPGLVIDVFGDAVIIQITTLGLWLRFEQILSAVESLFPAASIYLLSAGSFSEIEGFSSESRQVRGEPRSHTPCLEDGIALAVEPLVGQKTGMFLDQRPSRIRVGQYVAGQSHRRLRVLDCYAYTGGFSLQAARGGAAEVTAVDSSPRAISRIGEHALRNQVTIRAVEADVFRFLETATPQSYDVVIVDPPKFARSRKDWEAAAKGYERLNTLALTACASNALLVTCSCSQNVELADFERIIAGAAKHASRQVRVLDRLGPGPDHPLPPGFAEGQYLKVLFLHIA